MRVISFNANGIRSAARKGFFDWLAEQDADVVCVQETKAQRDVLTAACWPDGFHCYYCDAEKKGYSGTAIYLKHEPDEVVTELGFDEFDREGRWCEARFGDLVIASLYLPSGTSSEERLAAKMRFHELFLPHLQQLRASGREVIICGDWNTAHKPIDLANPKNNAKNSGFLPEERAWLDRVFDEVGMVDAFRAVHPDVPDLYTWWSNRGRAREKNVGWRIDYQIVTPGLRGRIRDAWVHATDRFSDHAPLVLDYELDLSAVLTGATPVAAAAEAG